MWHRLIAIPIMLCCLIGLAQQDAAASGSYTHKPATMIRLDGQSAVYKSYSWTWNIDENYGSITSALLTLYFYDDDA